MQSQVVQNIEAKKVDKEKAKKDPKIYFKKLIWLLELWGGIICSGEGSS